MNIEDMRLTPEELLDATNNAPRTEDIVANFRSVNRASANAATDKAILHYDKELRPYLEDVIEVLSSAQGEWNSVTKTYAPAWTHPFKEIENLIDEALKEMVKGGQLKCGKQ